MSALAFAPSPEAVVASLPAVVVAARLGDLPGWSASLEIETRGKVLAELLQRQPELPGVLLTSQGRLVSAVSRRYYLESVGRFLGMDLYHPRPIRLMMERFDELGGALILPADTTIAAAVASGLARCRELVYEPVVVDGGAAEGYPRLVDFEDLLLADARLQAVRGEQMRQILATVREGLLLVGPDLRIAPEYSDAVNTIFDPEAASLGRPRSGSRNAHGLAGLRFDRVVAAFAGEEVGTLARDYMTSLFDRRVIESLVAKVNPLAKLEIRSGDNPVPRQLEVRFARGYAGTAIHHLLVRIEDVTERNLLAQELDRQRDVGQRRLTLALAAVRSSPTELVGLLSRLDVELAAARTTLADPAVSGDQLRPLARALHGLKGESGLLGLSPLEGALHVAEDRLAPLLARSQAPITINSTQLRAAQEAVEEVSRHVSELREVTAQLSALANAHSADRAAAAATDPTKRAANRPLLHGLSALVAEVARDSGKQVRLVNTDEEADLPDRYAALIREVAIQLVRNAVVHGIESPVVRRDRGKPPAGTIQLVLRQRSTAAPRPGGSLIELVVQDDGGGLDRIQLAERAAARGLRPADDAALDALVFEPGISTAGTVTRHAGRGVGLDLVKARVSALGGHVSVHHAPGLWCAFRVLLPLAPPALSQSATAQRIAAASTAPTHQEART